MAKDAKNNKRGCFIVAAIVAILVAALVWGIISSRDDPRTGIPGSDGAVAVDAGTSGSPPPKTDDPR